MALNWLLADRRIIHDMNIRLNDVQEALLYPKLEIEEFTGERNRSVGFKVSPHCLGQIAVLP